MGKFRKQINNLIIFDASPKYWRECKFKVKTRDGRVLEEFDGGLEGKQKAIDWARSTTDFVRP